MRVLNSPKVYLIARPQVVKEGLDEFLQDHDFRWPTPTDGVKDAELLVEICGRQCYQSFGNKAGSKTNFRYIQNLIGRLPDGSWRDGAAHGSVCEHPCWSFIVTGSGRGFSAEQIRHRSGWAYSELSTRYVDMEREKEEGTWEPGFCLPPMAQLSEATSVAMTQMLKDSQNKYIQMVEMVERDLKNRKDFMDALSGVSEKERDRLLRKAARGAARDVLPLATEAIMVMSANARALWNCIVLRGNEHAEAVIRQVYVQLAKIMEKEMPALFHGIKYSKGWDGNEVVTMPREKL